MLFRVRLLGCIGVVGMASAIMAGAPTSSVAAQPSTVTPAAWSEMMRQKHVLASARPPVSQSQLSAWTRICGSPSATTDAQVRLLRIECADEGRLVYAVGVNACEHAAASPSCVAGQLRSVAALTKTFMRDKDLLAATVSGECRQSFSHGEDQGVALERTSTRLAASIVTSNTAQKQTDLGAWNAAVKAAFTDAPGEQALLDRETAACNPHRG